MIHIILAGLLLSDAKRFDYFAIAIDVFGLHIIKQAPALPDQFQQAPTRREIFGMLFEVLGNVFDAFGQHRDLHFRGTSV